MDGRRVLACLTLDAQRADDPVVDLDQFDVELRRISVDGHQVVAEAQALSGHAC